MSATQKTTLENALVIGTAVAGVTADQYDKIKNVSFKKED